MSDKIQLTEAVLIDGEVAKPGVYDRDQFTESQLEWLTVNGMCSSVTPITENKPADGTAEPQLKPMKRKRQLTNDITQTL